MADETKKMSKLDRLNMLLDTLILCRKACVKDADEWKVYDDMMAKVGDMLHEEHKRLGWSGVYEIKDGMAADCLFEGDNEACDIYVEILLEGLPEMKGNLIISPLY